MLIDVEGRRILDFHGNSVHQLGHGHPKVVAAIKAELDVLPFCPRRFTNGAAIALARKLVETAPGALNKVLLAPSGAAAISMALKLARYATGRHKTLSMWDSFHGANLDTIAIGGEALFRQNLGPMSPGAVSTSLRASAMALRLAKRRGQNGKASSSALIAAMTRGWPCPN